MRKVYELRNKAEAEVVIVSPSGRTKYKIKFTGGVLDPKNKVNAKYTTDNPIMQRVVENSVYYGKTIFCVGAFGDEAKPAPAKEVKPETPAPAKTAKKVKTAKAADAADAPKEDAVKVMEDVTDLGAAVSILLAEGDVKVTEVSTYDGVIKKAKEKGISFPNLNKE